MMKGYTKESNKGAGGTDVDDNTGTGTSKKAKKVTYEKQLDDINKELRSNKSVGNSAQGKGGARKQKLKPEQEVVLLEQKCILLLKLKRHKEVVDDGYSIIGRLGPNVVVYKCILIALVRLAKPEEDIIELIEAWKKATPKCTQMLETKRKFDGYLAAMRSGMKHTDIFSGIEDALSLNADSVLSKQISDMEETNRWRFRAPPPRHTTFSMCPRASSGGSSCIYGDECLFAHSPEEIQEWKSRVELEKKNMVTDEMNEEGANRKKRPIPNMYRSLLIPPLCIHYLLDLGKKIKEASEIQEILVDEIPAVKIKVATPLKYQKRIDGFNSIQCTWSFMVGSKMPMGTVSILHDSNRESFSISNALYYNKKKETVNLIELHPNNKVQTKLQVLNTFIQPALFLRFNTGWPDTCVYKVDVSFESRDPFPEPGLYRQSIVFDFKKDPKVVKHISIEVLPKMEPIGNHLENIPIKSPWAAVPPPLVEDSEINKNFGLNSASLRANDFSLPDTFQNDSVRELPFKAVGFKNMAIIDSETGQCIRLNSFVSSGSYDSDASREDNLFLEDVPLTVENYRTWWKDFIDVELIARQKAVKQIKTLVDVTLSPNYYPTSECIYKYNYVGELYGKIEMISDISLDPRLDNLITYNCSSVLIYTSTDTVTVSFRKTSPRYLCKIVEKSKSTIFIAVGKIAIDELQLLPGSIRRLHVQFVLDPHAFEKWQYSIDVLSSHHMRLLFPNFEGNQLPVLKVLSSATLLNEEELFLNSRQQSVYSLLCGRKETNADVFIPPFLITGGVSTGKSHLLAHSLRGLLRLQSGVPPPRILIFTRSDVAADVYITDYLHKWLVNDELSVQRSKPLRIYDVDRYVDSVGGAVKHYCLFNFDGTNFRYPTRDEVLSHRIIIVTVSSCSILLTLGLDTDTFSHIIIDEAAQCLETEAIEPIVLAGKSTRLIVAGDVVVTQSQIFTPLRRVTPLSLIERLRNMYPFRHPLVMNLFENYSNHEVILRFISETFYHDQLRPASNQPCHPRYYPLGFHHISTSKEVQADNGGGYYNMEEIRGIVDFLDELLRAWPATWGKPQDKDSLIVVTPYINHIKGLRVQLQLKGLQWINVDLASNMICRKFKVVIISTVRSPKFNVQGSSHIPEDMHSGFFSNKWLVNISISSAKSLVMVFGDLCSLLQHGDCREIWLKYAKECQAHNSLHGFTAQEGVQLEDSTRCYQSPARRDATAILEPQFSTRGMSTGLGVPGLNSNQAASPLSERTSPRHNSISEASSSQAKNLSISQCTKEEGIYSGNPWSHTTLSKAPKADLFSAFSSDVKSLYGTIQTPRSDYGHENQKVIKTPERSIVHDFSSQATSTIRPNMLTGYLGARAEASQQELKNEVSNDLLATTMLRKTSTLPLKDAYTTSFEMMSLRQCTVDKLGGNSMPKPDEVVKNLTDVNLIDAQPMPLPVPTIPSQVLFDTKLVIGSGTDKGSSISNSFESSNEAFGLCNSPSLSPQKFVSPLMRGPPGFAPISYDSRIGGFSSPEHKASYPTSPHRNFAANANGKSAFKRNTYELPPRMLKNLHLTVSHSSPTRKKLTVRPAQAAEMNFFEELGLDSQRENCRSASSTSSDQSFMDMDETICVVEEDCSSLSPQSDWIEVKSTRKGKSQSGKKKSCEKRSMRTEDSEESSEVHPEMCVDDKVGIITQMGFTKSEAIKALLACEKDLQRAVDWLISKPRPDS